MKTQHFFTLVSILLTMQFTIQFTFAQESISKDAIQRMLEEDPAFNTFHQSDKQEWLVSSSHMSDDKTLEFIYLQQTVNGIPVYNGVANIVTQHNKAKFTGNRFEKNTRQRINLAHPTLLPEQAIQFACKYFLEGSDEFKLKSTEGQTSIYEDLRKREFRINLTYVPGNSDELILCYGISFKSNDHKHWWHVMIDASNGAYIQHNDWVKSCQLGDAHDSHQHQIDASQHMNFIPQPVFKGKEQYKVIALPGESPAHAPFSTVFKPADPVASPYGWHDVDAADGAEYTSTVGNNVTVQQDISGDGLSTTPSEGGNMLHFLSDVDESLHPNNYVDASLTNLFYVTNKLHDISYHYGFDEASGNFQKNNYGNGGVENDALLAEGQDGSYLNNGSIGVPPDGQTPHMELYLWEIGQEGMLNILAPSSIAGNYFAVGADFGTPLSATPLVGELVLYQDAVSPFDNGCEVPVNPTSLAGKIAVIRRGGCYFVDKVQNAEDAGAIAVIVVNSSTGSMVPMSGPANNVTIPSIMVDFAEGNTIISELLSGSTIDVSIQNNPPVYRDACLDNGIIAHEFAHGISMRLTGGAANSDCFDNDEEMGEGWSDWFALVLTMNSGDQGHEARGVSTYVLGQSTNGGGIRPAPYSTDFTVNPYTYGSTNSTTLSQPHGIGFVWAEMVWDLTWALIDKYGYDSDLINGTGGNNVALNLAFTALKIQPCSPGFVDARDALLQADQLLYEGANQCLIWSAFAARGLGYSASQGSPYSRFDQIEAFDLPPSFQNSYSAIFEESCGNFYWEANGQTYNQSGIYYATLTNSLGCDSTISMHLIIHEAFQQTETVTSCNSYNWTENGLTYTQSGVYNQVYSSTNGCDSIYTLVLQINETTIGVEEGVLFANVTHEENVVSYTWYDCNSFEVVSKYSGGIFQPIVNGSYFVVADYGSCTDTTECLIIDNLAISEQFLSDLIIYPNPTNGDFNILIPGNIDQLTVRISDAMGKVLSERTVNQTGEVQFELNEADGLYFIEVENDEGLKKVYQLSHK